MIRKIKFSLGFVKDSWMIGSELGCSLQTCWFVIKGKPAGDIRKT
jgi:hypothetical protein